MSQDDLKYLQQVHVEYFDIRLKEKLKKNEIDVCVLGKQEIKSFKTEIGKKLKLGIDIEAKSMMYEDDEGVLLAIGMRVVDPELKILDEDLIKFYVPTDPVSDGFKDKRTYDEYFIKMNQLETLKLFEYDGDILKKLKKETNFLIKESVFPWEASKIAQREINREGMMKFLNFRKKWEQISVKFGYDLKVVSDNPSFDISLLNFYITKYVEKPFYPFPYSASKIPSEKQKKLQQRYSSIGCVTSLIKGICAVFGKEPEDLGKLYELPKGEEGITHDHNPVNDAYTIAVKAQHWENIKKGKYKCNFEITM